MVHEPFHKLYARRAATGTLLSARYLRQVRSAPLVSGGTGTVVTQQSASADLAAEFLCWAKMSDEGEKNIWDTLGFDVCNTACWTDDAFAHDDSNQYNAYFRNYPYPMY